MWIGLGLLVALAVTTPVLWPRPPADLSDVRDQRLEPIRQELSTKGMKLGDPIFIRIFKESGELELWVRSGERYALYKTFPICTWSGDLGPKQREGDGQAPEGFYSVSRGQMNPNSRFHLSFNLGFPNAYDRAQGRTGSFLMVHGNCVSIGCYAMTDAGIEEIWLIADEALRAGQASFDVHAFPFRPSAEALRQRTASPWLEFWQTLKTGYDRFEATHVPPVITVANGVYVIN
jgi:murein L,D-transpeptidase YafK